MFVQVIKATATDPGGLRKQMDRWNEEVGPVAKGFLGSTAGITEDGSLIVMARFESEDLAAQNSDLPEQGSWWEETSQYLKDPEFINCSTVDTWLGGGSDDAGFVQIIEGTVDDRESFIAKFEAEGDNIQKIRPEILGGLIAWRDNNHFTEAVYFTSEAEARKGEANPESQESRDEAMGEIRDLTFHDIKEPILR